MAQIKSKIFQHGSEKESKAIPDLPKKGVRGRFWFNPETGKMQNEPYMTAAQKAAYFIQTDEIPPTESMATADRKIFTSRKKLEEYDRQHGFIHTGGAHLGQKPEEYDPKKQAEEIREDARRAHADIKYDRVPFTELEKELCRREERAFDRSR